MFQYALHNQYFKELCKQFVERGLTYYMVELCYSENYKRHWIFFGDTRGLTQCWVTTLVLFNHYDKLYWCLYVKALALEVFKSVWWLTYIVRSVTIMVLDVIENVGGKLFTNLDLVKSIPNIIFLMLNFFFSHNQLTHFIWTKNWKV